jgi:Protein of unknown function (DUF2442)
MQIEVRELPQVTAVEHAGGHRLRLRFADGLEGEVDLAPRLAQLSGPVFEPLRDAAFFAQVSLAYGTACWPNGCDWAPETLYHLVWTAGGQVRRPAQAGR